MSIAFADVREPMSFLARSHEGDGVVLAKSDASDRVLEAVRRYVLGQTTGRAIVIAGHRGAGKSTVVHNAVQQCARELKGRGGRYPILVRLNGPSLLDPAVEIAAAPGATGEASSNRTGDRTREKGKARLFLSHLAMALYKALGRELVGAVRRYIDARPRLQRAASWELLGSLQIELDDVPSEGRLRTVWNRFAAFEHGLLGISPSLRARPWHRWSRDQGMRELVALASAARAFREVIYDLHVSVTQDGDNAQAAAAKSNGDGNGHGDAGWANALAGLATGGLMGAAGRFAAFEPGLAAFAAIATGAVTTLGLSYSRTYSSSVSRSVKEAYERDPDKEASLGRMLPDLLDRVEEAGLVPIFVVEELDKVRDLDVRFGDILDRTKLLVTDRAFFCFIVDRNYLEFLKNEFMTDTYTKGYTFFSDLILVAFTPENLHEYLANIIRTDGEDGAAGEILRWILLHRARMHAIDLRREIERMSNTDRTVRLSGSDIRSRSRHRYDVLIQLAVELQLRQGSLRERCDREPEFIRFAHDAVYFASRSWEAGNPTLDASENAIRTYLENRIRPLEGKAERKTGATNGATTDTSSPPLPVSERDIDLLVRHAQAVVEYLADPESLRHAVADTVPVHVLEMVPDAPLLVGIEHEGDTYRWLYDFSGLRAEEPPVESQGVNGSDVALVEAFMKLFDLDPI